jgi:IMP dehydrogenase
MIKEALAFDDVLLQPGYSEILPSSVQTTTRFSKNIPLNIPMVSAAMDTVTEHAMAIAIAQAGGIGVIHKNQTLHNQVQEILKVKRYESGMVVNPVTIYSSENLHAVKSLMEQHNISGIPVIQPGSNKLVGIVTHRDVRFANDPSIPVHELMTKNLVTVKNGVSKQEAQELLHKHRIEKLMVVDDDGKCIGLITVKDIDKAQANPLGNKDQQGRLRVAAAVGIGDTELRRAQLLIEAGTDAIVIDTAHGHSLGVLNMVSMLKSSYPHIDIIAGNVARPEAAEALISAGADGVKIGIGPGCFVPGSIVITNRGGIPIEDVMIGDMVITHTGQWKPVINIFTFDDKKSVIKINNIVCTPAHEFYVLNKKWKDVVTDENLASYAEWITAEELTNDYLLIRHAQTT